MNPLFSRYTSQLFVQDLEKYQNVPQQKLAEVCSNDSVGNCEVQFVVPKGNAAVLQSSTQFYFQLVPADPKFYIQKKNKPTIF